ncbi:unnamed protein product [Prunus armeniaca]
MASTWPLACGCAGEEKLKAMLKFKQNSHNRVLWNWRPLSVMRMRCSPNLQMMFFHPKTRTRASMIVARGSASTYLVK